PPKIQAVLRRIEAPSVMARLAASARPVSRAPVAGKPAEERGGAGDGHARWNGKQPAGKRCRTSGKKQQPLDALPRLRGKPFRTEFPQQKWHAVKALEVRNAQIPELIAQDIQVADVFHSRTGQYRVEPEIPEVLLTKVGFLAHRDENPRGRYAAHAPRIPFD